MLGSECLLCLKEFHQWCGITSDSFGEAGFLSNAENVLHSPQPPGDYKASCLNACHPWQPRLCTIRDVPETV